MSEFNVKGLQRYEGQYLFKTGKNIIHAYFLNKTLVRSSVNSRLCASHRRVCSVWNLRNLSFSRSNNINYLEKTDNQMIHQRKLGNVYLASSKSFSSSPASNVNSFTRSVGESFSKSLKT